MRGLLRPLCWLLGHRLPVAGWYGDGLYGELRRGAVDGVGRSHFSIFHTCPRCARPYLAARFSLPPARPVPEPLKETP